MVDSFDSPTIPAMTSSFRLRRSQCDPAVPDEPSFSISHPVSVVHPKKALLCATTLLVVTSCAGLPPRTVVLVMAFVVPAKLLLLM